MSSGLKITAHRASTLTRTKRHPKNVSQLQEVQFEEDPTTISVERALALVIMNKMELAKLLRSSVYEALSEAEVEDFLTRPRGYSRFEGKAEESP